ncbi:MAG: adenine-specific methyltransferase EcoRI family protein [Ruminococcus sp.]
MSRVNDKMTEAKKAKNDEFYTLYEDIQKEINAYLEYDPDVFRGKTVLLPCDDPEWSNFTRFFAQNFENFGLKKLISTSFAHESKNFKGAYQLSLFEEEAPQFDESKTTTHGKIFTLTRDSNKSGMIDIDDLEWQYLEGDGDFRSDEVKALCEEADIIITNPPFSLFREFLAWIFEHNKQFLIIGNINCISYQEVFVKIKENKAWLGNGMGRWISGFIVPEGYELYGSEARIDENGQRIVATNNCLWLTNLEHGRRHQPLSLMTMKDNIKYSKHKEIRDVGYEKYDNYDAIDVAFTDAIPSDYNGAMGVPITFLDKYNPEQFEILGIMASTQITQYNFGYPYVDGKKKYARILIRKRAQE